jgi:hypothetical protein
VLPLALAFATPMPGNRWHNEPRIRELAIAALEYTAKSCRRDGSCDDYYPYERALGAAVFSLAAAAEAARLLDVRLSPQLREWFARRAHWLTTHDESGHLANHHALAALGLERTARLLGDDGMARAAEGRIHRVLEWQSDEGWFEEYGGADPGYQTVTIDCLAKYRRLTGCEWLDGPLERGVKFCRLFLHPDDSYAGEYGSRGTHHCYPHGFELLAGESHAAAELAEGFVRSLAAGKQAHFDDDRMFAHRLGNLIEAWRDWQPMCVAQLADDDQASTSPRVAHLSDAGLLVVRDERQHTIISAARGGVFKHFNAERAASDTGLTLETSAGQTAVSQLHDRQRLVEFTAAGDCVQYTVSGPLHWSRWETATPAKLVVFRLLNLTLGRFCRTLTRKLLQRRLITGRRAAPVRHERRFELQSDAGRLQVTDTIELLDSTIEVARMHFGTDQHSVYVAAAGVYQDAALEPWTDLASHLPALNRERRVTIVREFTWT